MEQTEYSRSGKHVTREERVVIERMSRGGYPPRDIAAALERHCRTIERELARGQVEHKDTELRIKTVYSSDRGQDVHDLNATAKGPQLKLGRNQEIVTYVYSRIVNHRESPAVVAFRMHKAGMTGAVCTKTLYTYIDQGLIEGVSNESLWEKRQRRQRTKRMIRRARKAPTRRQSIEKRPKHIEKREEFGHWEIDLIVGPTETKGALMTLVERKTRKLIIHKLKDKTHAAVRKAITSIERQHGASRFRDIFKSITSDNGSEFLDVDGMQNSVFSATPRTFLFYAHPYASWERGTNENTNRIIRRFITKDRKIESFTCSTIKTIEEWINNYPRKIIGFSSSHTYFEAELEAIAA